MIQWTWSPLSATEFIPSSPLYAKLGKKKSTCRKIGKHHMKNIFFKPKPHVLMLLSRACGFSLIPKRGKKQNKTHLINMFNKYMTRSA